MEILQVVLKGKVTISAFLALNLSVVDIFLDQGGESTARLTLTAKNLQHYSGQEATFFLSADVLGTPLSTNKPLLLTW